MFRTGQEMTFMEQEPKKKKFSPKQLKFINTFMITRHEAKSAIKAGYSKKTAYAAGSRLFRNPDIREEIERRISKAGEKVDCSYEEWLTQVKNLAFSDPSRILEFDDNGVLIIPPTKDWPMCDRMAVSGISQSVGRQGIKTKIDFESKKGALELLGKAKGFTKEDDDDQKKQPTKISISINGKVESAEAVEENTDDKQAG